MKDNKYIVFKRDEFFELAKELSLTIEPIALPDATVIRSQDLFAAPALHAYANSISVSMNILSGMLVDQKVTEQLREVSDYFHERAIEAEQIEYRKLPD